MAGPVAPAGRGLGDTPSTPYGLDGKVALVTGGCGGIGKAIVTDLLTFGAKVVVVDIMEPSTAEELFKDACNMDSLTCLKGDVTSFEETETLVQKAKEIWGTLGILINNAGINRDSVIWKMPKASWQSVIDTDLTSCFNLSRAAVPIFREQNSGKIVNISSINGLRGKFGQVNYSAAKAGVVGFTKALAKEVGAFNINVNAVAPGFIQSPMTDAMPEDKRKAAEEESVFKRAGTAEEVAALVTFLCSNRSRYITGEVIKVDGGQYI